MIMKSKIATFLATAALAASFIASSAYAECKLHGAGKEGIIVDNDLVRFSTNLTGETNYARTFDDTSWASQELTVEASANCDAIVYPGSGGKGHVRIKGGTSGPVPADARGVGCQCKK